MNSTETLRVKLFWLAASGFARYASSSVALDC